MTRALHELVDGSHESIDDPVLLERLNTEFRNTIKEFGRQTADPETIADINRASERIRKGLGALGLHETFALMDAAALSADPDVDKLAQKAIDARFPVEGTNHQAYEEANRRSRQEWREGLRIAKESEGKKSFGNALVEAEVITDRALRNDFDEVIDESNLAVKAQRKTITERERRDLNHYREERRRRQERQKLADIGELDDIDFDDAVKFDFDPFADD